MRTTIRNLFVALALSAGVVSAPAHIISFDLLGKAGAGLLSGNQNGTINGTPGSGGEVGSGIVFNDQTGVLTINVAWGSGNGFTDLSGNAFAGHIHGPTASSGTASFNEDAPVMINPLEDPTLELRDGNGALVASNDDWRDDTNQETLINQTGIPPGNDAESAILLIIAPAPHTAIVAGKGTATGVALVEAFHLE